MIDGDYRSPFIVSGYEDDIFAGSIRLSLDDALRTCRTLTEIGIFGGIQTAAVDSLCCPPRGRGVRKDEQSFADKTGHDTYWTQQEAAAIRACGERVATLAEVGQFPFDGSWCDFTPLPSWTVPRLSLPASVMT